MQTLAFHDGHKIPQLGFGLWEVPEDQTARVTSEGIALGYRLIDGAAIYGNEVGMGQGIQQSGVARDELFVTTKVWNSNQGYDKALKSVADSLDRLKLDRLDLCLIHWPVPSQDLTVATWRALIHLRDQGVITSIGVSNFNEVQIDRLSAETGVTPVLNQIELHPNLPQTALRAAHAARKIITQSWTPLGQGRTFESPQIQAIAKRLNRSPAQVILRWHIELGGSVIPRSTRKAGLQENLNLFDFALTPADHAAIATLENGQRTGPDPMKFGS